MKKDDVSVKMEDLKQLIEAKFTSGPHHRACLLHELIQDHTGVYEDECSLQVVRSLEAEGFLTVCPSVFYADMFHLGPRRQCLGA